MRTYTHSTHPYTTVLSKSPYHDFYSRGVTLISNHDIEVIEVDECLNEVYKPLEALTNAESQLINCLKH